MNLKLGDYLQNKTQIKISIPGAQMQNCFQMVMLKKQWF